VHTSDIFELAIFLLVVINPVSKVAILAALSDTHNRQELTLLSIRASVIGLLLLVAFAVAGKFLLQDVFRTKLYSIQVAGGTAIFLIGLRALREGQFFTFSTESSLRDLSAAPLGMPMIAGPASIAAVISAASTSGVWVASIAVVPAMTINLLIMLVSAQYATSLKKTHFLGPLVRIVGLFIAAIGADMVLGGMAAWLIANGIAAT
jgi:multiple antibiotic resistance protein